MRILVSTHARDEFAAALRQAVPGVVLVTMDDDGMLRSEDGATLSPGSEDVEVAWATHDLFVGAAFHSFFAVSAASPTLRWFQSPGAGVDSPFFVDLLARGVRLSTSHVTSIPIAEFVLRSVLHVFQDADAWARARAAHRWEKHTLREVWGTTWLVIGVGAIGSDVARRAGAFGATVIGCRRHPSGDEPVDEMVAPDALTAAAGRADVVVVSAPATAETERLVGRAFLAAMKPGSVLVNVARGSLVDEEALLEALDRGTPATAVLDAVSQEPPPPGSPLWDHPRIVLTPHNSFAGTGSPGRNLALFVDNLRRYREGLALVHEQHL